jgi:hypothetical protein
VAVRDAIETELENVLARKKSVQQGLDDAVAKGNEILREFASLYKQATTPLEAQHDAPGPPASDHETLVP